MTRSISEAERQEVSAFLIDIDQRLMPVSVKSLSILLRDLYQYYNSGRDVPGDLDSFWNAYFEDLAEFSEPHLAAAILKHRREKNWFPKTAELRSIAEAMQATAVEYRHRARVLLGVEAPRKWEIMDVEAAA